ncbi:RE1 [Symbiodinium sp. KB8]|nr:RE1 [Symbiodinium sp. KB8]
MASKITNAQLRTAIRSYGEEPPSRWNKAELVARLGELETIHGESDTTTLKLKADKPLQEMIQKLNRAAKTKATMVAFMQELGLHPNANDTILKMEKTAMMEIYRVVEPRGSDYVGFGKFAQMTYAELLNQAPSYAAWVTRTASESDSPDPKLVRLARWLERAEDVEKPVTNKMNPAKTYHLKEPEIPEKEMSMIAASSHQEPRRSRGYHGTTEKDSEDPQTQVMKTLVDAVKSLQEEIQELKEDKQRKQRAAVEGYCDRHQIYLDVIPGEAHHQIGVCEEAVKGLKEVMTKLSLADPEVSSEEALSTAIVTFNQREMIRGFSPAQHILGQNPDVTGRFLQNQEHIPPGDLVFFWRSQGGGQGRTQPGNKHGSFLGPARVLACETRRDSDGNARPGSAIWCVRGRRLLKCSPEQLRHASEREELVEALTEGAEATPWTYTKVAEEIGGSQYDDISSEQPSTEEWQRAQDIEQEAPPTRHRLRGKRSAEHAALPEDRDEDEAERTPSRPSRPARRAPRGHPYQQAPEAGDWTSVVHESAWVTEPTDYWLDANASVALEIEVPQTTRGINAFTRDLPTYFTAALRRQAMEVSEKRLTPAEKELFREAKAVEVKNFLAAQAFARAVLLGYQDPSYEHRSTTAPVMTRQTRQFMLQLAANRRWTVQKGDVSGAFLQGREYPDTLYCIPCDEICAAMQLAPGSITRLRRACYGLVDAPLEWYRTIATFLEELGLERTWCDACAWVWRKDGQVRGMVAGLSVCRQ